MSQAIQFRKSINGKAKLKRRGKNKHGPLNDELQFLHLQGQFRFFLGLFARRDLFAHLAGMRAIKGLGECGADRFRLKIRREHVRPRDSLQYNPMPARRAEQRENQQDVTETNEHRASIIRQPDWGRKMFVHRHDSGTDDWVD